ncbi:sensor domain-containing diguanylate cyclase, partial [Candidatus Bipolaricaulota bacterium]|nr:sensor domain-containing diguanylate cyclase [Candidatus Bipolaricaulota bacterium]
MVTRNGRRSFDLLVENALNGIYQCDKDCGFLAVNPALVRMLGYDSPEELRNEQLCALLTCDNEAEVVARGLKEKMHLEGMEVALKSKDGSMVQAILNARWVEGQNDSGSYHEGILTDISHLKREEAELLRMATHDPLTGLHNRREFNAIFERHLSRVRRYGNSGALLWMDLDGFKQINDSLGHNAGDELLSSIAHRMRATVRDSDVLARLGGDEFAVLYPNVDEAQAKLAAERLLEAIRKHTVVIEGQILRSTSSMGVVLFPEHGNSASELFLKADMAMYRAKASGRNRITMYSPGDEKVEDPESRIDWLRVIREALEND